MKKETEICDNCKKVVAITKCEFCGVDLCEYCKSHFGIGTENKLMFSLSSCSKCNEILQDADLEKDFKNCPDTKKELIEIFRRIIQLEELEGRVKKKKKKEEDTDYIKQFYPGMGTAIYPPSHHHIYDGTRRTSNHNFAWVASKAGKVTRYGDEDDKA